MCVEGGGGGRRQAARFCSDLQHHEHGYRSFEAISKIQLQLEILVYVFLFFICLSGIYHYLFIF